MSEVVSFLFDVCRFVCSVIGAALVVGWLLGGVTFT